MNSLLKTQKTNWKYILIVLILAVLVGGGILWCMMKPEVLPTEFPEIKMPEKVKDETADWKTYEWGRLEFKYPPNWTAEKIYYSTPAQQIAGEPPENIGVRLFPGKELKGNDFIAIGGRQVSCDPSENHTKCSFISSIANFIYTDSNNPEVFEVFDQIISTFKFIEKDESAKCSPIDFPDYEVAKEFKVDLNNDQKEEILRVYWKIANKYGERLGPIMVKIFSGTEDCPKENFSYQGRGNEVWGAQAFSNFWGGGANAVMVKDVSYAGGSGSSVVLRFFTYRNGKYAMIEGPQLGGHNWQCCKFDNENAPGKKIIGAESWWATDYSDYCAGCPSKFKFFIYTWNGEEYIKTEAGITKNKYSGNIDAILQQEPSVLEELE